MGSLISAIYDDYETYEYLCELKKVEPFSIYASQNPNNETFYTHAERIIKSLLPEEHEKYKNYYWYNHLK